MLDRLQLRPQERRVVVAGAGVLFLLLNLWFVWPHFGSLQTHLNRRLANEQTLRVYLDETSRTNEYLARLAELEKEGSGIVEANSDLSVQQTLNSLAQAHGLMLAFNRVTTTARSSTNEYFEQITFSASLPPTLPTPLVSLLSAIASNQIVMRVKELDLKPADPTRTKLAGSVKVMASFQKKSLVRAPNTSAAASATTPLPTTARTIAK